jgi:hypothetical protein
VHVDDHGPAGGGEPLVDQRGDCLGVRVEERLEQVLLVRRVDSPQRLAVRGAGVDGAHPCLAHLLALVGDRSGSTTSRDSRLTSSHGRWAAGEAAA